MQQPNKLYLVTPPSGRGHIRVTVTQQSIDYRGERRAIAYAAWQKLLGDYIKEPYIRKHLPSRKIIFEEEAFLGDSAYMIFQEAIRFRLIELEWKSEGEMTWLTGQCKPKP